jgi:hypothetical protein
MVASVVLLSSTWCSFADAATATVDCGKKGGIQAAIDKFDKSLANSLTLVGTCTEVVTVSGHRDLTIIGGAGASLTATVEAIATLRILGSRVAVSSLLVSGGGLANTAVSCDDRSVCILENVSARDAGTGIGVQKQSSVDIIGSPATVISGNSNAGIGVYGQSSANITAAVAFDQPGITISGNGFGIQAIDGSFVRVENAQITGNEFGGVTGDRGAVYKVFGTNVSDNGGQGAFMRASTLQVGPQFGFAANFANNAGPGIFLASLSYATVDATFSANGGAYPSGVDCSPSAVLRAPALVGSSNPNCGD